MNNFEQNRNGINWKVLELEAKHAQQQNERNIKIMNEQRNEKEKLSKEIQKIETRVEDKRNQRILLESHYNLIEKKLKIKQNQEKRLIFDTKQNESMEKIEQMNHIKNETLKYSKINEKFKIEIDKNQEIIQKLEKSKKRGYDYFEQIHGKTTRNCIENGSNTKRK